MTPRFKHVWRHLWSVWCALTHGLWTVGLHCAWDFSWLHGWLCLLWGYRPFVVLENAKFDSLQFAYLNNRSTTQALLVLVESIKSGFIAVGWSCWWCHKELKEQTEETVEEGENVFEGCAINTVEAAMQDVIDAHILMTTYRHHWPNWRSASSWVEETNRHWGWRALAKIQCCSDVVSAQQWVLIFNKMVSFLQAI